MGGHALTATYGGSIDFNSSASVKKVLPAPQKRPRSRPQAIVLEGHLRPRNFQHLSVKVSPEFAGSIPNGKVTVKSSSTTLCVICTCPSSGTGSCTLSAKKLSAGTYGLLASYSGSSDFGTSAAPTETLKVVT